MARWSSIIAGLAAFRMGRRSLLLLVAALVLPIGGVATLHRLQWVWPWPAGPEAAKRQRPASPPVAAPAPVATGLDPNLPLYVGSTKRIAAEVIDNTAASDFEPALVQLARLLAGTPFQAEGLEAGSERLRLDLTRFDDLRFVEQLLALANSRQVSTKTQAVDLFTDHVRRLRYEGGLVGPCRLHSRRLDWALAAGRRGYLVNLTPYLPGVRQRPLPAHAPPARLGEALQLGATAIDLCPAPAPRAPQAYLPVAALPTALPWLRTGDLVLLLDREARRDALRIGLIEQHQGAASVWWAQPGQGVVQAPDLGQLARRDPAVIGLILLRPIANPDGRAGG